MLEQADEVQDALGRQYGMPELDDDELAAELDALGKYLWYYGTKAKYPTIQATCVLFSAYSLHDVVQITGFDVPN